MSFLNSASYQFVELTDLDQLQQVLKAKCQALSIKGTILLSPEGINMGLSATPEDMAAFKTFLLADSRFAGMTFREGYSETCSFQRLKIKLKKEIITMRQPQVNAVTKRAPAVQPKDLKQWLDEKRDITLLDTRNDYEIEFGTFAQAVNPHINHFSEFPTILDQIDKNKPVVMFCTGGVRCEKAALYMEQQGYKEVYQLDGGILNYFKEVGGAHYQGGCYVFDERVNVLPHGV
jgi:UPF0176 protein